MLTILGARTRRLWPHLRSQAAAALTAGRRCVLLVPEQYTLQAERDLIRDLSLPGFFDIEVFSLSRFVQRLFLICGSNRVRVDGNGKNIALARALLYDAPLLVLDEPFKGLDETTARQCMDALARRAAGRAVLLVTHDAQEGDYLHARTLQMEKLQRV